MPLSTTGQQMLDGFKKRYGDKGEQVFYAYLNSHPEIKQKIEGKRPKGKTYTKSVADLGQRGG